MDSRAAKLALARKKLKDHQEKKTVMVKDDDSEEPNFEDGIDKPAKPIDKFLEDEHCENSRTQLSDVLDNNFTEILISNKRNLEIQVEDLQSKLFQYQKNEAHLVKDNSLYKQQLTTLELEFKTISDKYISLSRDLASKNKNIEELIASQAKLVDENSNLHEQLELTKSMLTTKESETFALHSQLQNLQNKLETTQLQLQQLTNGTKEHETLGIANINSEETLEVLQQKVIVLEQQLNKLQKNKEQMSAHYEHYVGELNGQLKSLSLKNEDFVLEIQHLSKREKELIDQISEMEIRLQNFKLQNEPSKEHMRTAAQQRDDFDEITEMDQKYNNIERQLLELNERYDELLEKYSQTEMKLKQMTEEKESEFHNDSISLTKLQADITSDKVAVQRATEQNKKLKNDLQNLEEAFVKMSKDKLELTEKLEAEKYLNRELTIRLADMEEKIKNMFTKLAAKDEEMIRLQSCLREMESRYGKNMEKETGSPSVEDIVNKMTKENIKDHDFNDDVNNIQSHQTNHSSHQTLNDKLKCPEQDAMLQLQERFLKIMEEVADLSDEKHRLEHIILQLQNETDTICEYVALYQQQRSLLKRRDEERSAQIKIFQSECELLRNQLEELSSILVRLIEDKELLPYFQTEPRHNDIINIINLLKQLKSNTIVDPQKKCLELNNFYPCSCCSGQLIDV